MKIILNEDIRGKGKRGDVLTVADGYGSYLIREKKAVQATPSELNKWQRIKDEDMLQDKLKRQEANIFKNDLEKTHFTFKVKANDGKVFGNITAKALTESINDKYPGMSVTKNWVNVPKTPTLGVYQGSVTLYKDIVAKVHFELIEE